MADTPAEILVQQALEISAPDLLAYFERRVGALDAPDLLGDLMVVAWKRISALPAEPEEARMWLFGIARHVLQNATRATRRQHRLAERLRSLVAEVTVPPADDGADVRDAVARLAEDDAELVRLVHWDGLSIEQAALLLQITPSTARSRYQRIKSELRGALLAPITP